MDALGNRSAMILDVCVGPVSARSGCIDRFASCVLSPLLHRSAWSRNGSRQEVSLSAKMRFSEQVMRLRGHACQARAHEHISGEAHSR